MGGFPATFSFFCRSEEVTVENESKYNFNIHLSFSDLAADSALSLSAISLNIKCSKTDQGRAGCQVVLGRTRDELCPVTALLNHLARRGSELGALFQLQEGTLCPRQGCGGSQISLNNSSPPRSRLCRP